MSPLIYLIGIFFMVKLSLEDNFHRGEQCTALQIVANTQREVANAKHTVGVDPRWLYIEHVGKTDSPDDVTRRP